MQEERRELRESLVVGRLCTPGDAKWPRALLPFYSRLAASHRNVDWEFVGCPEGMQRPLAEACQGRVRFLAASWEARRHLWRWDAVLYHHPTLTESFGRVAAEAMRTGCVPILDARGGFLEQVTPETGWLCASASEFDAALAVLACRSLWRTMSCAAMAHADDVFSLARFRSELLARLDD
jgi:glycosyltransferase involved in cell wall biosynthesis